MALHTEAMRELAQDIRELVIDLNAKVKAAAIAGLTTEYMLHNVEDNNSFHQQIQVWCGEQL